MSAFWRCPKSGIDHREINASADRCAFCQVLLHEAEDVKPPRSNEDDIIVISSTEVTPKLSRTQSQPTIPIPSRIKTLHIPNDDLNNPSRPSGEAAYERSVSLDQRVERNQRERALNAHAFSMAIIVNVWSAVYEQGSRQHEQIFKYCKQLGIQTRNHYENVTLSQ
jgi:hypothetical protein